MPPYQEVAQRKAAPPDPPMDASPQNKESKPQSPQNGEVNRQRKAARLIGMVNGLQTSMEAMMEKREFYAKRSSDLETALKESAPEALAASIKIRTIQVADIMMEIEDLNEKIATQEEQIQSLRQSQEREKQTMQVRLEQLMQRHESLQIESAEKQKDLRAKIAEADEETEAIRKKYSAIRKSYHSLTKNIAQMASKIVTLQRENGNLRVEADSSHKTLIAMERKVERLQRRQHKQSAVLHRQHGDDDSDGMLDKSSSSAFADLKDANNSAMQQEEHGNQSLQSQLDASKFENEKLIAERTANQSVISELRNQVQELQAALREVQRRQFLPVSPPRAPPSYVTTDAGLSSPPSAPREVAVSAMSQMLVQSSMRQLDEADAGPSKLDDLLCIVRSMSSQSAGQLGLSVSSSSSQPQQQASSVASFDHSEDTPVTRPSASSANKSATKVRRMNVVVNGQEGSYTGPVDANGLPHGTGTIRFRNGDTYLGELRDGKLHGRGTMYVKGKATVRNQLFHNNVAM